MRPTHILIGLALLTGCGSEPQKPAKPRPTPAPAFTAGEVATFFEQVTSDPLRADANRAFDSVTLGGDFDREEIARQRYGSFVIYILKQPTAATIYKTDNGTRVTPDPNGIYWHDETAMKPYRNVVLAWTADDGHATDERFERLDRVLSKLGTDPQKVRAELPAEDQPCTDDGAPGTCRAESGASVTTVARDGQLDLPTLKVKLLKVKTGTVVIPKQRFMPRYHAKGRYLMTVVRIKNTGDEPLSSLRDARLKIGSRTYEQDSEANFTVVPYDSFPLQPDDTLTTAVIFDIPARAARDALDHGTLAFPAGAEDYMDVEDADAIGQIQLRRGASTNPGTNA